MLQALVGFIDGSSPCSEGCTHAIEKCVRKTFATTFGEAQAPHILFSVAYFKIDYSST